MIERPILMSAPMVRAILDGRKTQTRRVIKPQPPEKMADTVHYDRATGGAMWAGIRGDYGTHCPYGVPGDRLWVREAWSPMMNVHQGSYAYVPPAEPTYPPHFVAADGGRRHVIHRAGKENYAWGLQGEPKWRPGIHMPRTACRLMLEVKAVRVERLHDITEADAKAEGVEPNCDGKHAHECPPCREQGRCVAEGEYLDYSEGEDGFPAPNARESYRSLWDSLNADRDLGWAANPWVWVIEFERLPEKAAALPG